MILAGITSEPLTIAIMVILLVALVAVVFVLPIINNKKQQKSYTSLLDTVKPGSTIKTIGGIVGVVKDVITFGAQKEIILETGDGDGIKTLITFDINAVYQVLDSKTHEPISLASQKTSAVAEQSSAPELKDVAEEAEVAPVEPIADATKACAETHVYEKEGSKTKKDRYTTK